MDYFKKFLIFWIFCILIQRSYGRKHHSYVPYYGSSKSVEGSKFVEKEIFNMHPESSVSDGRLENTQLYKIDADVSKSQKPLSQSENKNHPTSDSTGKTIEMKVGEHLVKVRSEKEPLSSASEGSSINPKYSHVIEIIHRDDLEKEDKLAQIYDATEGKQAVELTKTAGSDGDSESDETEEEFSEADGKPGESDAEEEFSETDDEMPEESDETEEEFSEAEEIPEEFSEADEIPEETEEEFSEADEIPEESEETEEEFSDADEEMPEESEETEEEFSDADEEMPEESDETEEVEEVFSDADEQMPEESDETEEEFSESDEIPEESDEAEEEIPEESDKTEEEFSEAEKEIPEESDETEDKFSEDDEELQEESYETNEEEFSESDVDIPEESYETNEEEFSESDVDIPEESDITNEEKFSEADRVPGESDEIDKEDDEADEKNPEEIDEGIPIRFGEANEKDSDATEDTKNFAEWANSTKKSKTSNEHVTINEDFKEVFEGSGEEFADINDRSSTKTGRILGMFSRKNETFPTCTTPKGEAGHCRRLGECLLSEALNNFNGFLQQLCLIRGVLVGICCPDNPVIETLNPDENATSELIPEEIKQPPEGCGLNTKTRIVGGSISVPHEWTWMVALMRRNRFYCGGVIINNWYILTAAHCVMGMNVKDLTVRLGEYDFNEDSKHTEDLSVAEIKRHAQFVTLTFQHDIALLKLKRSIKYSKFVGSICLPEQKGRDYSDVKGTVVGWGTVSFGGAASPVLRQVTVPVWKNKDCDRTYLLESIGDSFMCAGSPEKGEDACQGDSGGPLMAVTENGRWEVIGLVSWGRRCGDPTYPGVYTRVTTYLDWIKQNAV